MVAANHGIVLARERLVMMRLVQALRDATLKHYFPTIRKAVAQELTAIQVAVHIAHINGHTATPSAIARQTSFPRSTVVRRLGQLIRLGYIERRGRAYCMVLATVNSPATVAYLQRCQRLILRAAHELTSLDTKVP